MIQLVNHSEGLQVALFLQDFQLFAVFCAQNRRIPQSFSAEVGAARIYRIIHPDAFRLLFLLKGHEFDVE